MITIVDYKMGNIGSIVNMFKKIGVETNFASSAEDIENATKLLLPGVGHFKNGMEHLKKSGLVDVLNKKVLEDKTPILGICLGMQLMTKHSEEGNIDGLGWIDAETNRFDLEDQSLKVPHMGWNKIEIKKKSPILKNINDDNRFYFVHSYAVSCKNNVDILTTSHYGYDFVSAFNKNNIYGMQFHPEKSHRFGMQILKNFVEL